MVGLADAARRRAGSFSLGMAQRLGIAAALLGDPQELLLDEPVNGLDPAGIHWIRDLLKSLAAEGRVVFVSSHLISEMALMAEHLVVIGQGRLLADTSVDELSARAASLEDAFLELTGTSTGFRGAPEGSREAPGGSGGLQRSSGGLRGVVPRASAAGRSHGVSFHRPARQPPGGIPDPSGRPPVTSRKEGSS